MRVNQCPGHPRETRYCGGDTGTGEEKSSGVDRYFTKSLLRTFCRIALVNRGICGGRLVRGIWSPWASGASSGPEFSLLPGRPRHSTQVLLFPSLSSYLESPAGLPAFATRNLHPLSLFQAAPTRMPMRPLESSLPGSLDGTWSSNIYLQ